MKRGATSSSSSDDAADRTPMAGYNNFRAMMGLCA